MVYREMESDVPAAASCHEGLHHGEKGAGLLPDALPAKHLNSGGEDLLFLVFRCNQNTSHVLCTCHKLVNFL